jgi:type I restriction enzyme S subunit
MKPMIEAKGTGSTFKAISKSIINEIEIPLPPLPIQRRIVAVLEQGEVVKHQRQEADALTGALLQNMFYAMFGDPVRNEKGWDFAKIDEICDEITVGIVVRPASYYVESGIPAFRSLNIRPDSLDLESLVHIKSLDNDAILSKSKIRSGDVLVVRTGYPGTACVVPPEFDGANCIDLIILRPKKQIVDCNYLSRFLNSDYGKALTLAGNTGLAQQHLNIGAIRQVKIPLPPLPLQQQFARVVQEVERIRDRQVESGREIEGLCEGLMQRAFNGDLVTGNP